MAKKENRMNKIKIFLKNNIIQIIEQVLRVIFS